MKQITEDYVSLETAKLLKEKGFDELCFALYNPEEELIQCGVNPKWEWLYKIFWRGKKHFKY